MAPSVLITYGPTTWYKISEKTNERVPRKNVVAMDKQINQNTVGHFRPFSSKQEFSQKMSLPISCKYKTNLMT